MRRFIFGAALIVGAIVGGASRQAMAQPYDGADRRFDRADDRAVYYGDESRGHDDRGRGDGDGHEYDSRETYGYAFHRRDVRHFCWYESGWHGRGSYWCGYARRVGYGWAGGDAANYEYRGNHYRGYWEDGTGRRYYDRGGYGVGHFDYGR